MRLCASQYLHIYYWCHVPWAFTLLSVKSVDNPVVAAWILTYTLTWCCWCWWHWRSWHRYHCWCWRRRRSGSWRLSPPDCCCLLTWPSHSSTVNCKYTKLGVQPTNLFELKLFAFGIEPTTGTCCNFRRCVSNERKRRKCVLPDIWVGVWDCPVRAQKEESGAQSFRGKLENFFCHFSHPAL